MGSLGTLFILEKTKITNFIEMNKSISDTPSKEDIKKTKKIDDETKKQYIEQEAPEQSKQDPESNVKVTASRSDDLVIIYSKLKNFAAGECKLSITNGNNQYSLSAPIIYQPDFSSCAGFSVPVDKLGAGEWGISITASYNGIVETDSTSLEVQ